jgi:hypothetical protein
MEKEKTRYQSNLKPVKPFETALGPFELVQRSMIRSVHACIDAGGVKCYAL